MRWIVLLLSVGLVACTYPVVMKNPKSGQIAYCGPYWTGLASDYSLSGVIDRELQCVRDFKEQGFVRAP